MIPAFPVYLFDVDGTLLDSAADICNAIREASLTGTRHHDLPDSVLRGYIGRHLIDLYADLFPEYSAQKVEEVIAEYRRIYLAKRHSGTRVYPGVVEGLARLGGRKSTATTKGTPTTRSILEQFGLIQHFDHVQGTDGFPAKPEPDVILKSLEVFGAKPEECLMVGDSPADMAAARRAGVKLCAVRYGYGDPAQMAQHQPDYWIDDLRDLGGV